jgi:gluconokinase
VTLHVVVMGVAGTGKSAVGRGIAEALDVPLTEGDEHHPRANIEKMSSGVALTDEDRWPWLDVLAGLLADDHREGRTSVLACSALRRVYRDRLRGDLPDDAVFVVHLQGSRELLEERMSSREHFMPVTLLDSQFATLEPLEPDEHGAVVDIAAPVEEVVAAAVASLPR